MSTAWRCALASSAATRRSGTRPRSPRSALTRHSTAASTAAGGIAPSGSAAGAQATACARAAGATRAVAAAMTAAARSRSRTALRAIGRVATTTRASAPGPRGGVPGMLVPSARPGPTHKTPLVLRLPATFGVLDEPVPAGPHCGLEPVAHADVPEDVAQVALDGLRADPEPQRDLLVRHAGAHEREHLALAIAQVARGGRGAQIAYERHGDARRQRRLAGGRRADARDQLVRARVLEEVADRARVERVGDVLAISERGQHDDPRRALAGEDPLRRLDPADDRHLKVHEHDVGRVLGAHRDRLGAVAGDADELDGVGAVLEHLADADPHDLVVVGEEDADGPAGVGRVHHPLRAPRRPDVTVCQRRLRRGERWNASRLRAGHKASARYRA